MTKLKTGLAALLAIGAFAIALLGVRWATPEQLAMRRLAAAALEPCSIADSEVGRPNAI